MKPANATIDTVLRAFERGDVATLLQHIDDNIDFRIDHYQDDHDISWQRATNKDEFLAMLRRVASEVFPQGTKLLDVATEDLGGGWAMTRMHQQFYYGVQARHVDSRTWIVSHSHDGRCDYFRETVGTLRPLAQ
jgi:ketosteroid isomerase-like protein